MDGSLYRQRWSRWLHLACGVPIEHVSIVLGLAPSEVKSFMSVSDYYTSDSDAERWRRMHTAGLSYRKIALAVGRRQRTVWQAVNRGAMRVKVPSGPPRRRSPTAILGQCSRHIRSFKQLGYSAERIAELLVLHPPMVCDLLARLEPLRRPRANPDRLTRPRYDREERKARRSIQRANDRRQGARIRHGRRPGR